LVSLGDPKPTSVAEKSMVEGLGLPSGPAPPAWPVPPAWPAPPAWPVPPAWPAPPAWPDGRNASVQQNGTGWGRAAVRGSGHEAPARPTQHRLEPPVRSNG